MATAKQLDDITECHICTKVYTDPRVLPCGHTFCLKCLETYSKKKRSRMKLPCPLCWKEFTLPSNGVGDLPTNSFVGKFLQMKELSSFESKTSPCDACSAEEVTEKKVAAVYCVECQQKLCPTCEQEHNKFTVTRTHKTTELSRETSSHRKPLMKCKKHADKDEEIYCVDCNTVVCMMCYVADHNGHKCSKVDTSDYESRQQITRDSENVAAGVQKCREMLRSIEKKKKNFQKEVRKIGKEICRKAEQLEQMIENHKRKLMNELSSMEEKIMTEIESLHEEIERQLMLMGNYKTYVDEIRQKGTAGDVARATSRLHDRADELLKFDAIERTLADLGHADVTFKSSNYVTDHVSKTLGQLLLSTGAMKSRVPTLTHLLPSSGSAFAVTSLGDDVLVALSYSEQVEVYDAETFTLQRRIAVPGLSPSSNGFAVCAVYQCIYTYNEPRRRIHRVELSGKNAVKKWSVHATGLSVNKSHNLVVVCHCFEANKLQEYTTHGSLVREICLQADLTDPWHAVQLSTGHYVVSQCESPGVVSIVGVDGQVKHSYGQSQTSDVGEMDCPSSLAVTKNDDILVADEDNNRILLIIRSTGCVQELDLSISDSAIYMQAPHGLCLDESRGRLYVVGKCEGCDRVFVFDHVNL